MIWFYSDSHFGHSNIIHLTNRPFATVADMDRTLIKNFNSKVGPDDEVYFLGDFSMKSTVPAREYFKQLNGKWNFIIGNHDNIRELEDLQHSFKNVMMIKDYYEFSHYKKRFVLSHYPILSWNGKHRGSIHLHGHSHGTVSYHPMAFDVGVDSNKYFPVSIKTVELWVARAKEVEDKQVLIDEKINWNMIDHFGDLYDLAVKLPEDS